MAQEIKLTVKIDVDNAGNSLSESESNLKFDQSGNHCFRDDFDVNSITDTHLAFSLSIVSAGWAFFKNLNESDICEISTGTGASFNAQVFAYLYPGEPALLPIHPTQNYYARFVSEYGVTNVLKVSVAER